MVIVCAFLALHYLRMLAWLRQLLAPAYGGNPNNPVVADNAAIDAAQQRLQQQITHHGVHLEQASQVYECQRWYGMLWQAPLALLDHPGWADSKGSAVALPLPPPNDPSAWEVVVNDATDAEGWQYGTVYRQAMQSF